MQCYSKSFSVPDLEDSLKQKLDLLIDELVSNGKSSVVLCGHDDIDSQIISFRINEILKSEVKSKPRFLYLEKVMIKSLIILLKITKMVYLVES